MKRAACVLLGLALMASAAPLVFAQEAASSTPPVADTLPADTGSSTSLELPTDTTVSTTSDQTGATSTPGQSEATSTSGTKDVATTTEDAASDETDFSPQMFQALAVPAYSGPELYQQLSAYANNGTIAVGIKSSVAYEYQAGVAYTPTTTQAMQAASFVIDNNGRTGHIHAEVWKDGALLASSEDRDVTEFASYNDISGSQNGFESGLETFTFSTPVTLEANQTYFIVAGANDDLSGYLDEWVSFSPGAFGGTRQNYDRKDFQSVLNANFVLYGTAGTPACAENCNSSVLFLPGLKGSVLESGSDTLWPADLSGMDFPQLALNDDGTSVNNVLVNGILPSFKIHIPALGDVGPEIYSGFISYMDNLVGTGVIQEWEPLPYDWRYSPDYIVSHDVQTPHGPVNLVAEVEQMASAAHSRTGKVTIVGHSMGGLVGKALIKALEDKGEANLVESFIMIGTPELGTPQAAASLLHGDQEGIPGKSLIPNFVATHSVVRAVGRNLPGAYSLLPSAEYFQKVIDPAITFDPVFFTQDWRNYFGPTIGSYQPFVQFLTGASVARSRPNPTAISIPEVLRPDLVASAGTFHDNFDTYAIPSNIHVVEVAGWGEETTKAVNYDAPHLLQSYDTTPTIEGDGVVVYPSAIAVGEEDYYFNLDLDNSGLDHGTLLNAESVQGVVGNVISNSPVIENRLISSTKPNTADVGQKLRVSTHSPVILGAYDSHGNFTGVYPNQDLSDAFLYVQENIPGSTFSASGETQSLYLPRNGSYTFVYKGIGTGPTTVSVEDFSDDTLSSVTSYADIPTTSNTSATFIIDSSAPESSHIQVDQNGDGQTDTYVAPDEGVLSLVELIANLKTAVNSLSTPKPQQKTQLLNKIANIETKIAKQKQKQADVLTKLQAQVAKKAGKGKIDTATANTLSSLLDDLIAQAVFLQMDLALLQQLKDQINGANITAQLKANMLAKVARLENIGGVSRSLASMTKSVSNKGTKGVLSNDEVTNLLNLLDQIQWTI